jgi:hypothetical protein
MRRICIRSGLILLALTTGVHQGAIVHAAEAQNAPAAEAQNAPAAAQAGAPPAQATPAQATPDQATSANPAESPPPSPETAPTLDLKGLEQRLRDTHAIGLFTKLSLKNQVDDLLARFRAFHQGNSGISLAQLRRQYELLLLKVVSLLQDDDPELASTVTSSRQAIWNLLADPKTFANI